MRRRRLTMLLGVGAVVMLGPVPYATVARAATGPDGRRTITSVRPERSDPDPAPAGSTSVGFRVLPPAGGPRGPAAAGHGADAV
ncbi:hypothetical protein, partial [Actinoallomurus acaciae]